MNPVIPNFTPDQSMLQLEQRVSLSCADLMLIKLDREGPDKHDFRRDDVFWIDLCLTPRRLHDRARYVDLWSPHRYERLGSIIALPPGFSLRLLSEGGQHISLICALQAAAVHRWLPGDFEWTDRRLETCLNIASPTISGLLLRLSQEMRHRTIGTEALSEALVTQLSVEIARYLLAIDEPTDRGGLASWRLRLIDKRIEEAASLPTLVDLAQLCNISTRQLTRGFRTSRGCSIRDYVERSRLEAAKRRLATDESIKSIATATGFSSQSAFTFAFRRSTGVTPNEFRQRMLRGMRPAATGAVSPVSHLPPR